MKLFVTVVVDALSFAAVLPSKIAAAAIGYVIYKCHFDGAVVEML